MKRMTVWMIAIAFFGTLGSTGARAAEKSPDVDLWTAATTGNLDAIKQHVAVGADLNAKEPAGGSTPLMLAALLGQTEVAKILLENGADINIRNNDGATVLHTASFFCRTETVKLLLKKGANLNVKDSRGNTALDVATVAWSKDLEGIYRYIGGLLQMQLDMERIKATRPKIAALLKEAADKAPGPPTPTLTHLRGSYFKNGEIHVNTYGSPEGKPVTSGHQDFKPSWSKTGDMLVFFRRLKHHPVTVNWITQIHVINSDGTDLHPLTDGTHTDFNQTWMRDGSNRPIWNRKNPKTGSFHVMMSKADAKPGEEISLTDKRYHTWGYTCLVDGRILVQSAHPRLGRGYYLMTPNEDGKPKFERIDCELAKTGLLDRVSVSPSETKVCFEYQKGFLYKDTGRTLYLADFDAEKRTITNAKPIANAKGEPHWYAYPRFNKDETAIVYHCSKGKGALYLYTLADGSTRKVSTNPNADYRYPHFEDAPK